MNLCYKHIRLRLALITIDAPQLQRGADRHVSRMEDVELIFPREFEPKTQGLVRGAQPWFKLVRLGRWLVLRSGWSEPEPLAAQEVQLRGGQFVLTSLAHFHAPDSSYLLEGFAAWPGCGTLCVWPRARTVERDAGGQLIPGERDYGVR